MFESTYLRLTLILGLFLVVQSQKCLTCPSSCKTCQLDPSGNVNVQCLSCASGYTFDPVNFVCYQCKAASYYDPSQAVCVSCPQYSSCCSYTNGQLSVCGCQSGYTLDTVNGVCYKGCVAAQYYDPTQMQCSSCPTGASCCSIKKGILTICGCVSGQSLDSVNDLCYTNCLSNQYYDANYQQCMTCPLWSSPQNVTANGMTTVSCVCNSGYKVDAASGNCIKQCATNQLYNYTSGNCQNCGTGIKSCAGGIISCLSGYTFDGLNNVCYSCTPKLQYYNPAAAQCVSCPANSNCCNYTNGVLSICGCMTGYTLDATNGVCYKCASTQYYSFSTSSCVSCPPFSTCCNNNNGIFTLCGCQSGYIPDTVNNICYKGCTSVQYYNPSTQLCTACPSTANCCRYVNGILSICGCPSGQSIDTYNGVCYPSCTSSQYYDPVQATCSSCGLGVSCCKYDPATQIFSVCGCMTGYTMDMASGVCYVSCTALQYYDPSQQTCISCPSFATCCNYTNGVLTLCGCQSGYTQDSVNGVCYKCAANQYYDVSQGACTTCPGGASCCTVKKGVVTICGCPKGYTLDQVNSVCYITCTSAQYYDASQQACSSCPGTATCCSFTNGVVRVCGCPAGQSIDPVNDICYINCASGSYWDTGYQSCLTCPQNAAVCNVTQNGLSTQTCCCNKGYSLDTTGSFCQKNCLKSQFYNQTSGNCVNCPANAQDCPGGIITNCMSGYKLDQDGNVCYKCNPGQVYDPVSYTCANCPAGVSCCTIAGGVLSSICGCLSGYTLDSLNMVCYRCAANQYYSPATAKCASCPTCAAACSNNGGYITVNATTAGTSWDPVNQACYSCSATQYYNVDIATCVTCPSCATKCSYLGGGQVLVPATISGYSWDSLNQVCVKACSTPTYIPPASSCSCSGYTFDKVNSLCYKCTSLQYFNPSSQACNDCPQYSTCCSYTNGVFSICGCQSGYTLDAVNGVCYKCNSGTYWSSSGVACLACPGGASCCTVSKGVTKICGCPKGYTIDAMNNICYLSCTSLQYYDSTQQQCLSCPAGATCCTFSKGVVTICGCPSGYSIDAINGLCYLNCATNQYYSADYQQCMSCPAWSSVCTNTVAGVSQQGCCCNSGFALDPTGSYCQKTCSVAQYYDLTSGSCIACPKNAKNCTVNGIISCITGYTLDFANNICYSCSALQYYNPAVATCQSCPSGASCCKFDIGSGALSVCGCQSGFSFDPYNSVCYKCSAGQYWNPVASPPACQGCPANVACCNYTDGALSICGCNSGYTLDTVNGACYSCKATQYYDFNQAQCSSCPAGSTCCSMKNGILTICACASGYTLDSVNQVCYQCKSTEYYNAALMLCVSCPSCATGCLYKNNAVTVLGTMKGFSWDPSNQVCYTSCTGAQYYDPLQMSCQSCPFCASSCSYSASTNQFTISSTITGYNWNATSQLCYCNTGQYLSFASTGGAPAAGKAKKQITSHLPANYKKLRPHLTTSYAGEVGKPETFNSQLGSTTEAKATESGKYLYESSTTLMPGTYADVYALYPWTYTLEQGTTRHLESGRPTLDVAAHTMWGLTSDLCGYFELISEEVSVDPELHMPTLAEDTQHPCGHYVVFTADAEGGAVTFRHLQDGAVEKAFSALFFIALWFFNF